jgi:hypothetical protein
MIAIAVAASSHMSEAHISSVFLQSRNKMRVVRACVDSFDVPCAANVRPDAQDVVSRKCEHARSCENALIFLLLV